MNEIRAFNSDQFGEVRTVTINDEPWFVAADVCRALEISDTHKATDRLDADEKGRSLIPTLGGQQEMLMASPSPMGVKPYSDEEGREYPVDAGVIGIVPLELVRCKTAN